MSLLPTAIDWERYLRMDETPLPGDGVYEPGSIVEPEAIHGETLELYEHGRQAGEETPWRGLADLYTVRLGQWTVVTGIPGAGKSAWVDNLMVHLAEECGWRWGVFSAENLPFARYAAGLAEIRRGKPFHRGPHARMTADELAEELDWMQAHIRLIPPVDGCTLDYLLAQADRLVTAWKLKGLVIDPWNEVEHRRPAHMTEYEYLSRALGRVRNFARTRDVHVIVVAHPRLMAKEGGKYPVATPYDISGGAGWWNKCDNAISIWRNYHEKNSLTEVHVQKIRFRECGRLGVAELYFDTVTGRFADPWQGRQL